MTMKTMQISIPTIQELLDSLMAVDQTDRDNHNAKKAINEIRDYYARELSNMVAYAKDAVEPQLCMNTFRKQGSQWIADFSVSDLKKKIKDEYNWHLQNTSQMLYNGCILYEERDGMVSTHH